MMTERKQTPNVLAEMLGGETANAAAEKPLSKPATRKKSTTPATKPRQTHPTKKTSLEYQIVSFQEYHGWRARYTNGEELDDWMNQPVLHEFIKNMAAQGWSVKALTSGQSLYGASDRYQVVFEK